MDLPVLGREEDAADDFAILTALKVVANDFSIRALEQATQGSFLSAKRAHKDGRLRPVSGRLRGQTEATTPVLIWLAEPGDGRSRQASARHGGHHICGSSVKLLGATLRMGSDGAQALAADAARPRVRGRASVGRPAVRN
jgi:hypothetical protein